MATHAPFPGSVRADPMQPVPYVVDGRVEETSDTFTLALRPANGAVAMDFAPGQFNMLYAFGTGESAISISGAPNQEGVLHHTIRRVGIVTSALSRLVPGDILGVRGPFGSTWPVDEARGKDLVFVAGGIGLAPLRPVILHARAHREDYGSIVVLVGARSPNDVVFHDELLRWGKEMSVDVRITVDQAGEDWQHQVGVVTSLIPRAAFDAANTVALVCGPEIMMRFTAIELAKRGIPNERLFITMERNMKCAVGFCGHCQLGPEFVCRDGPVFRFDRIRPWFSQREL